MSHTHYVSKDREGAGEGHPGAPCCAGQWENTEQEEPKLLSPSWRSAECWVQGGVPGKGFCHALGGQGERERSLGPQQSSGEEGLWWEWQSKAEGKSWSLRAGDRVLMGLPGGVW